MESWTDAAPAEFVPHGDAIDPTKAVFDLAEPRILPADLRPWMLLRSPDVPVALENAKSAYRAHIQSANRDTLKALGDLRRAVIEETQKTVQRTHELTSALWRDLLVAAAPFVIKLLPDTSKLSSKAVAQAFLIIAATYLLGSFLTLTFINRAYFAEQERSRMVWQNSLIRYLPPAEIEGISDLPITRALAVYRKVHIGVGLFYLVLFIGLLSTALAGYA